MRARALFRGGLVLALLVLVPLPMSAQPQVGQRWYVVGLGGAAATEFATPSAFFGASVAFEVADHLQITADGGRMQDVLANFTSQDLSLLQQNVNQGYVPYGAKFTSTAKVPTNYLSGGVRVPFFAGKHVRPYVSAGAGLAHMSPEPSFKFSYQGTTQDVTQEVMNSSTPGCAWRTDPSCVSPSIREETRPMATAGVGMAVTVARHVTFDFGYRYSGIFIQKDYLQDLEASPHSHGRIDTHRMFAGAGFTF